MNDSYTAIQRLLYVTIQLFIKQGFSATSVDQICRMAGVSKGAFFHYFRSKDEAAEAAIDYFGVLLEDHLFSGLEFASADERLLRVHERMLELPVHFHFENGSLYTVIAAETTPEQTGVRKRLEEGYVKWASRLAELFTNNGYDEQFSLRLARQWIAVYEGAIAQAKATADKSLIREQLMLFGKLVNRQ